MQATHLTILHRARYRALGGLSVKSAALTMHELEALLYEAKTVPASSPSNEAGF